MTDQTLALIGGIALLALLCAGLLTAIVREFGWSAVLGDFLLIECAACDTEATR